MRPAEIAGTATALLAAGCIALLSGPPAPPRRDEAGLLLPKPGFLRVAFPGYSQFVADYYWIRTINQVGAARTLEDHRDIAVLANQVAALDPRFAKLYTFAAISIPYRQGRGYALTQESTDLLRLGVQNVPGEFQIRLHLAYNLMFFHDEHRKAAEMLLSLSKWREAPPWLPQLATRLLAHAGDFSASRAVTAELRDQSMDPETRDFYETRLKEIDQEELLRGIDAAILEFRTREGRPPSEIRELVEKGFLPAMPVDPLGGEIVIASDGRSRSTHNENRLELIRTDAELELP